MLSDKAPSMAPSVTNIVWAPSVAPSVAPGVIISLIGFPVPPPKILSFQSASRFQTGLTDPSHPLIYFPSLLDYIIESPLNQSEMAPSRSSNIKHQNLSLT